MHATDTLSADHRLIERAIAVLELAASRLAAGVAVPPRLFADVVGFIRGFADGTHHRKEEDVLFPAMAAQGMPVEGGPIAVMLFEHERGRGFTASLADATARIAAGDRAAVPLLVDAAHSYAGLLREHICKEDNILFAMAGRVIPPPAQAQIVAAFDAIDRAQPAGERREDYVALVERLEREIAALAGQPSGPQA